MKYNVYYSPLQFYGENIIELSNRENHLGYSYSECPVWGHMMDRTFVGYSPIHFEMSIGDDGTINYSLHKHLHKTISPSDYENEELYENEYISFEVKDIGKEQPVIQLSFTNSYIWTDFQNEYLWFEYLDHPLTSLDNNFVAVGGWFNIASHPRNTSLAIKILDRKKPVSIIQSNPLYRVRFYTDNMNDKPILRKKELSNYLEDGHPLESDELYEMHERRMILTDDKKFMNKILFDKDIRKKCPFHDV